MKTLLQATIDGINVVTHIGEAAVDPQATTIKVSAILTDTPEWPQILALEGQIADRRQQAVDAFVAMFGHAAEQAQNQAELNYWLSLAAPAQAEVEALNSKTIPLRTAMQTKEIELRKTNAVYSVPSPAGPGYSEALIDDDAAAGLQEKFATLTEFQRLGVDGTIIPDLRGLRFWSQSGATWAGTLISALGKTPDVGSIAEADLTADQWAEIRTQQESARVAALTSDQKNAEAKVAQSVAQAQARAAMDDARLSGKSDSDVLAAGQAVYVPAIAAVNLKYGTTLE